MLVDKNQRELVFQQMVEVYESARKLSRGMIHNDMQADDIVQEAFVKIVDRMRQGESFNNVKAYLKKTVKHLCIDWLKRQKEFTNQDEFWEQYSQHQTLELEVEMNAEFNDGGTEAVFKALAELPEIQRKVLILHYFDGKPYSVIADELGIQEKTARNLSYKGRKKMKEILLRNC